MAKETRKSKDSSVFAVHKWETTSGYHDVTSWKKGGRFNGTTKRFRKWTEAEKYANEQAKKLGIKKYQVDTPQRPHTMIKVR